MSHPEFRNDSSTFQEAQKLHRIPKVIALQINSQKVFLDLLNTGFAVLAVDPLGQGERLQY